MAPILPNALLALMSVSAFAMIYAFISAMFVNRSMTRPEHIPTWGPFLVSTAVYGVSLIAYLLLVR